MDKGTKVGPWLFRFKLLIVLCSAVLSWQHMIRTADALPAFFTDEVPNVQAGVSFFSNGQYRSDRYGLGYSSGIAVTWPSTIGWNWGHNMLASRIGCALFTWLGALLLGFCFFRGARYSAIDSLIAAASLWALTVTPPLAIPYWFGFMYDLGELNSIILIGFGLLLMARHPFWSVFIFGMAVWHGKLIYFPFVGAMVLGDLLARGLSGRRMAGVFFRYAVVFLLPLFLWVVWLYVRFNSAMPGQWLADQLALFSQMKVIHGANAGPWFARFTSPPWEWVTYSTGTKIKNLLFSLGAIGITLFGLNMAGKGKLDVSKRARWISVLLIICIGLHAVHHFFVHPYMWQRHFQPSLYMGFGLLGYWSLKWVQCSPRDFKPFFYAAAILLVGLQAVQGLKHPSLQAGMTYARLCTDLYRNQCDPAFYK